MQSKDALQVLASLFFAWALLYCTTALMTNPSSFAGPAFATLLGAAILATFYHFISLGSPTARILLVVFSLFQVLALASQGAAHPHVAYFVGLAGAQIAVRLAIVALVFHPAIWRLVPEPVPLKTRPIAETHEHDWQPHELLDDWIRCGICKEMHIEPGTVALVNRR